MTPKVLTFRHFEQSFLYEISEKCSNHHHYEQGYSGNDMKDGQKKFFKLVNEYRPNRVNLEDIMSWYCNKQTKIMIIGEWKMNVVALMKLIYSLKVSTLISSNKRPYLIWKLCKKF